MLIEKMSSFNKFEKRKDTHDHDMDLAHDTHGGGKSKY